MNMPGGAELLLLAVPVLVIAAVVVGFARLVAYFVRRDQRRAGD